MPTPTVPVALTVNGSTHHLELDVRSSLLDALREQLHLTGSKKGCDHGQCGACTVLVEGRRINSCLALAVAQQDREITTVEGLAGEDAVHPMQEAFLEWDAYQCGYCTPGQITSAVGMVDEARRGWPSAVSAGSTTADITLDESEVRERMSGNICRCAAYVNIVSAVLQAAEQSR